MIYFIYDPFTENHKFLVNNLKCNLNLFNYKVEEIHEINDQNDDNYYIIIINHMFFIKNDKAKIDYNNLKKKKKKILYITEPIELIIEIKYYNKMINELKPMKIFTYCEENLKKIKPLCKYINFYPINKKYMCFIDYSESLMKYKDYSKIIFIGKMNNYRNKIKDIFQDDLIIIENQYKKEEWIKLISKYQYFINVHRRPNSMCFESMRILPLLYNNCSIISEHVNKKEEEYFKKSNIHFCKLEEMKNKLEEIKKFNINEILDKSKNVNYSKYINMIHFFED